MLECTLVIKFLRKKTRSSRRRYTLLIVLKEINSKLKIPMLRRRRELIAVAPLTFTYLMYTSWESFNYTLLKRQIKYYIKNIELLVLILWILINFVSIRTKINLVIESNLNGLNLPDTLVFWIFWKAQNNSKRPVVRI
jgi:hypothetical protein